MAELAVVALNVGANLWAGKERKKLKEAEAQGYRDAAHRRMAVATREASEEVRKKEFVYSRALAVMGAQGASMADPGIQALLSDLNAEGEYRVMSVLWTGQNDAEALRYRADVALREGEAAKDAAIIGAVTSAVSTYAGFRGFERDAQGNLPNPFDVLGIPTHESQMKRALAAQKKQWGPGTQFATEEDYLKTVDLYYKTHFNTQFPYR